MKRRAMRSWQLIASVLPGIAPMSALAAGIPSALPALCPKAAPGEIVVCGDRDPLRSPYRLPADIAAEPVEGSRDTISLSRERNGLFDYDGGGTGSCSASGAGGASGCGFQRHRRYYEQKSQARDRRGPAFDGTRR